MTSTDRQWLNADFFAGAIERSLLPPWPNLTEIRHLQKLLDEKEANNTERVTKTVVTGFNEYLKERRISEPQDKESIARVLKLFYAESRKRDGTSYSKSTLTGMRFSLDRHFKSSLILISSTTQLLQCQQSFSSKMCWTQTTACEPERGRKCWKMTAKINGFWRSPFFLTKTKFQAWSLSFFSGCPHFGFS